MFLKDTWRVDFSQEGKENDEKILPEIVTYSKLRKAKVDHILTVMCGGDVRYPELTKYAEPRQRSLSHHYIKYLYGYVHARLVFKELALPLEEYDTSEELCLVAYHGLQGKHSFSCFLHNIAKLHCSALWRREGWISSS